MQFVSKIYLYLLFVIPALIVFLYLAGLVKQRRMRRFAHDAVIRKISYSHSRRNDFIRTALYCIALLCMIIALARPQWGEEKVEIKHRGIDVMFVIDTSLSMLAEDIVPNRFEKARLEVKSFIKEMRGDRIGLVAFAGNSYLACPLTIDHAAFRLFLNALNVGSVAQQGTAIAEALTTAMRSFNAKSLKDKVIILLSDGEDHEGSITDLIAYAREKGIRIYCIGMGRKEGQPIPLRDQYGKLSGYKKDQDGTVVMSSLHDTVLLQLAKETGGLYFPSTAAETEVETILRHLDQIEKKDFDTKLFTQREEQYHVFLIIAFIALCAELLLGSRRKKKPHAPLLAVILLCMPFFTGAQANFSADMRAGNSYFERGEFDKARQAYENAKTQYPSDAMVYYNLGNALFKLKRFDEAQKAYKKALELVPEKAEAMANIIYNLGNAQYRSGDNDGALKSYKAVLDMRENDEDAKYNIEVINKNRGGDQSQSSNEKQEKQQEGGTAQQQEQQQDNEQNEKDENKQDSESNPQQEQSSGGGGGEQKQEEKQQEQQGQTENQDNTQSEQTRDETESSPSNSQQEQSNTQSDEQTPPQNQSSEQQEQSGTEQQSKSFENEREQKQEYQTDENESEPESSKHEGQRQVDEHDTVSYDDAMRILEALQETEQDIGAMRMPSEEKKTDRINRKDW